jgi:hypothetical protein
VLHRPIGLHVLLFAPDDVISLKNKTKTQNKKERAKSLSPLHKIRLWPCVEFVEKHKQ